DAARWSWDLGRIHAKGYTDNLVDLMVGKLTRLTAETQKAIQQLASLGNAAAVATLSLVSGTTETEIHSQLEEAVRADLLERGQARESFNCLRLSPELSGHGRGATTRGLLAEKVPTRICDGSQPR